MANDSDVNRILSILKKPVDNHSGQSHYHLLAKQAIQDPRFGELVTPDDAVRTAIENIFDNPLKNLGDVFAGKSAEQVASLVSEELGAMAYQLSLGKAASYAGHRGNLVSR
ncbi:MAG: hypothetical protein SFW63_00020 [Alphaproteobacteria bacterium]|nr:hypothetical protein [Alphaproteobacteria bacterium]